MRYFLYDMPCLVGLVIACQTPDAPTAPSYEGQYALQTTYNILIDNYPVYSVVKGTLTVVKNADGTYTFTEKLPLGELTYSVTVTGKTFALPELIEPFLTNTMTYNPKSTGFGEFKTTGSITNSVTITRMTPAFDAGSARINRTTTSFGYH